MNASWLASRAAVPCMLQLLPRNSNKEREESSKCAVGQVDQVVVGSGNSIAGHACD